MGLRLNLLSMDVPYRSKYSLGSLIVIFTGSNLVSMGLRILGGFLVARFTEPATLGLYNSLGLVLSYSPFLLLGISNGMNRELPFYYGKGDTAKAKDLAATAQAWALVVSSTLAAILLGLAGYYAVKGSWLLSVGWAVQAFSAIVILYGQFYLEMTFRTRSEFVRISMIYVIQQTIGLISVPLVWVADFFGLCARGALMGISYLGLLWHWRPLRIKP